MNNKQDKIFNSDKPFHYYLFIFSQLSMAITSIAFFIIFSVGIAFKPTQLLFAAIFSISTYILCTFVVYLPCCKIVTRKINKPYADFLKGKIDDNDEKKYDLFKKLSYFPIKMGTMSYIYFLFFTIVITLIYFFTPQIHIDPKTSVLSYFSCFFASYIVGLISFFYCEKYCGIVNKKILDVGIPTELLIKQKHYGLSFVLRTLIVLVLPIVFTNVMTFIVYFQGSQELNGFILSATVQKIRMVLIIILNLLVMFGLSVLYYEWIKENLSLIRENIGVVFNKGDISNLKITSLNNEMHYNIFLLNQIIEKYFNLLSQTSSIGTNILNTTTSLSVISNTIYSTSQEQNSDVKEILSTMEDANSLSKNISGRISGISIGSEKTEKEVQDAFEVLEKNIQQMENIEKSHEMITKEISSLDVNIKQINKVVKSIEEIAEQTKNVALNSELQKLDNTKENSTFHIISKEINRLVQNTVESIEKINTFVETIVTASNSLTETSENESNFIKEEKELILQLKNEFNNMKISSNESNIKAKEILATVDQETTSFNQIVITLRQITAGIEQFVQSTTTIKENVDEIESLSKQLSSF